MQFFDFVTNIQFQFFLEKKDSKHLCFQVFGSFHNKKNLWFQNFEILHVEKIFGDGLFENSKNQQDS